MARGNIITQLREIDFNELEFNTIGVWPLPVRVGVLALLFVLALCAAYYFHIRDLSATHDNLAAQETTLRQTFEEKAFEAANLEAYRQQVADVESAFNALLSQLPSDTEVPGLLEDITEIGLGSSMEIDSIALAPEKAAEFYVELPIQIAASGGYHDFGSFVSGVAALPRIVTLHDFSIREQDNDSSLVFEVTARTYRYKMEGE